MYNIVKLWKVEIPEVHLEGDCTPAPEAEVTPAQGQTALC